MLSEVPGAPEGLVTSPQNGPTCLRRPRVTPYHHRMNDLVRRLRGALGIGVTWGVLWAAIGLVLGFVVGVVRPDQIDAGEGPGKVAAVLGLVGFLSGLGFSALIAVAERRRTIRELSLGRVALWGLLGAAAIPLLTGADASVGLITGPMGALFATTSVVTARRGTLRGAESPTLLE